MTSTSTSYDDPTICRLDLIDWCLMSTLEVVQLHIDHVELIVIMCLVPMISIKLTLPEVSSKLFHHIAPVFIVCYHLTCQSFFPKPLDQLGKNLGIIRDWSP